MTAVEEGPAPAPEADQTTLLAPLDQALDQEEDTDSLYAGSIAGTDSTSLKSSITKYREELGRTYHSYGSTEHWGPNDPKAQDQQDLRLVQGSKATILYFRVHYK